MRRTNTDPDARGGAVPPERAADATGPAEASSSGSAEQPYDEALTRLAVITEEWQRARDALSGSSPAPTSGDDAPATPGTESTAASAATSAPTSSAPTSAPAPPTAPAEQPAQEPPATSAPEPPAEQLPATPAAEPPAPAPSQAASNAEPGQPSSGSDASP